MTPGGLSIVGFYFISLIPFDVYSMHFSSFNINFINVCLRSPSQVPSLGPGQFSAVFPALPTKESSPAPTVPPQDHSDRLLISLFHPWPTRSLWKGPISGEHGLLWQVGWFPLSLHPWPNRLLWKVSWTLDSSRSAH